MFLSVAIIARNEASYIGAALYSAQTIADELVVVLDPRTTDATAVIAAEHGARVVVHPFESFAKQRNVAIRECRGTWLLFLDADERITPELAEEIQTRVAAESSTAGYWIPRHNLYFGQRLRGGGWYPDFQLRLFRRAVAHYDEARPVHELVQIDGATAQLTQHLLHINIETWPELHAKQRRYALIEAQMLARQGVRAKWRNLLLQPLREIKRRFITWRGYRDGQLGLVLAVVMGGYELLKYIHLKGLNRLSQP